MAWGFAAGDMVALAGKLLGVASVIGLAAFFQRMYHMRMLMRRAKRDHGVVRATWFPDASSSSRTIVDDRLSYCVMVD